MTTRPDDVGFDALDRHRRELRVHCYRMVGSAVDAEDLVQETLLRAWRARASFAGRSSLRTWLYQIATNACLDWLRQGARRTTPVADDLLAEAAWLQPLPGHLLTPAPGDGQDPEPTAVARETVELAFIVSLAHLPPRQRAVLIVRDVLGWTAAEAADALGMTVPTANSLLQRARTLLRHRLPVDRSQWTPARITDEQQAVLRRYIAAHEGQDPDALISLLRQEIRVTMPPEPPALDAVAARAFFTEILGAGRPGEWRLVATSANGQPAAANYLRRPGDGTFRALSIDVLRVDGGRISEINCFLDTALFDVFSLPRTLPSTPGDVSGSTPPHAPGRPPGGG